MVIKPSIIQLCKLWSMSVYRKAVSTVWPGKQIRCDPVLLKAWSGEQLCLLTLLSVLEKVLPVIGEMCVEVFTNNFMGDSYGR